MLCCVSGGTPIPVSATVEPKDHRVVAAGVDRDAQQDLAAMGELDGIAHQVDEDLAEPPGVSDHHVRHVGVNVEIELQPLLVGPHRQGL